MKNIYIDLRNAIQERRDAGDVLGAQKHILDYLNGVDPERRRSRRAARLWLARHERSSGHRWRRPNR